MSKPNNHTSHPKVKQKEKEIRILILGLDNAGKTTILRRLTAESIDTIEPTLGFNIKTLDYKSYHLNIWDVGGQKTIRAYWRNYFEKTDGVIWVVDSADVARLEICRSELEGLLMQEKLVGASLLIMANKQDVGGALGADEIATVLGLESEEKGIFENRHVSIRGCSAVSGEGLVEGVDWMVEDISSRIFMLG
jgi:ADP-ribosylation factor-like protein 2